MASPPPPPLYAAEAVFADATRRLIDDELPARLREAYAAFDSVNEEAAAPTSAADASQLLNDTMARCTAVATFLNSIQVAVIRATPTSGSDDHASQARLKRFAGVVAGASASMSMQISSMTDAAILAARHGVDASKHSVLSEREVYRARSVASTILASLLSLWKELSGARELRAALLGPTALAGSTSAGGAALMM
jgi:hypothetical protein